MLPESLQTDAAQRITPQVCERLESLATQFCITVEKTPCGTLWVLSGRGFSESEPLHLAAETAPVRLLAEICEKLVRWVSFSLLEPCEQTLLAIDQSKIDRWAGMHYRQVYAQEIAAEKAQKAARALSAMMARKQSKSENLAEGILSAVEAATKPNAPKTQQPLAKECAANESEAFDFTQDHLKVWW